MEGPANWKENNPKRKSGGTRDCQTGEKCGLIAGGGRGEYKQREVEKECEKREEGDRERS